jgi:rhodanese-related sulfurtransferase
MRKLLLGCLLGAQVLASTGCTKAREPGEHAAAVAPIASVTVDELDHMLATGNCQAVDANGDPTRRQMGVIPGAVLLTDMDSLDKLPADKATSLVFYCANPACGASEYAAAKAMTAGYTHVKVLPEGIAGWVKAGKKTSSI